jgi:hypothetical protein
VTGPTWRLASTTETGAGGPLSSSSKRARSAARSFFSSLALQTRVQRPPARSQTPAFGKAGYEARRRVRSNAPEVSTTGVSESTTRAGVESIHRLVTWIHRQVREEHAPVRWPHPRVMTTRPHFRTTCLPIETTRARVSMTPRAFDLTSHPNVPTRARIVITRDHVVPTSPAAVPTHAHVVPTNPVFVPTHAHVVSTSPAVVPTRTHVVPTRAHVTSQISIVTPKWPLIETGQPHRLPTAPRSRRNTKSGRTDFVGFEFKVSRPSRASVPTQPVLATWNLKLGTGWPPASATP